MISKEIEDAEKELTMESLRKIKEYMKDMTENHQYCSYAEQEAIRYLELYINDSTPNQLIRDKIEELEKEKNNYFEKQVIQGRIELLKDLLGE